MSADHAHERTALRERWPLPGATSLRDELLAAWASPGRGYHDLVHLREVLDRLDELEAHHPFDPLPVRLAAWFHDAVYEGGPDDEARSATWAARALPEVGFDDVAEVERLVLLTVAHSPAPDDRNGVALCDADLAILAAPAERYAAYCEGVRTEYAHVPDELFAAGRAAVLRSFLERPHVFATEHARARWEPAARTNAERELTALEVSGRSEASGDAAPPDAAG